MAGSQRLICASDTLIEGGDGIRFEVTTAAGVQPAFVVRHEGRVRAFLNRCGHVPVELDWQPGRFFDFTGLYLVCATHGALYEPATGRCIGGRCNGNGLVGIEVVEREGGIYLIESEQASE